LLLQPKRVANPTFAELYGNRWAEAVRSKAIKALGASKSYAQLTANLTQKALTALPPTAAAEIEAPLVATLARSARLAGLTEIADKAEARSAKLEGQLDEEYHKKVPPFTPSKFAGRKNAQADRVVVMELFTGAQCPPCVAADVGYDALLTTYGPKEFIGLQYHLHIPGPDPMTNEASEGRQKYYGDEVGGTPATFFNGQSKAGGGGPMQASENKYTEFRQIIDAELEKPKESAIKLSAALHGDQIEINAEATVDRKSTISKPDDAVADEKEARKEATKTKDAPHSKPRLRLALTEESVRYVGGNRLRFHHHVVRAFPGGVEGKDLSSGSGRVDLKVSLADLKRELEEKNSADAKSRPFPSAPPVPALKKLSLVAFVQDDADKVILHAVSVPVE